uniref:CD151_1 protein n=1 Tax=Fopius arisanus TaxID=64838 RepID=A0A0C9RPK8_9HYME
MALGSKCLWYMMLGCFIVLGMSGVVVCAAASFFTYQFQEYSYHEIDVQNVIVSPVVLITFGLLTCPLAGYFWWVVDRKYNRSQFFLFTFSVVVLSSVESFAGVLAMVKHHELNTMLSTSLEDSLKSSPRFPPPDPTFNHTEIKVNCCTSQEISQGEITLWLCCDFERHENTTRISCEEVYGTECRHLTINRYQSILIHVFLLALSSVTFQVMN